MENSLIRLFGWRASLIHGDPTVYDRYRWIRAHLKRGPYRTLDAGCGTGAYSLYAAQVNKEVVGISFNERNNEVATKRAEILGLDNIKFIQWDLRQLKELAPTLGKFDQIICSEVIEHLLDDQTLVNCLAQMLKPDGRLLLSTPYKGHRPVRGETTDPEYTTTVEDGGHVRFGYWEKDLKKLVHEAGLTNQRDYFVSGWVSQKLYNLGCDLDQKLPHKLVWAMTFPLRLLQIFDRMVTKWLRYPCLSIATVAVK